jgi:thiamine pyrophosphokinase
VRDDFADTKKEATMAGTVIVAGGTCDLSKYGDILSGAYLIGADRGALYLADAGYHIDMAVGDFDSVDEAEMGRIFKSADEVKKLPAEKNETDLEHAINRALDLTSGAIYILGATGSRLDQTMSALYLLKRIHDKGREAFVCGENNRIRLIDGVAVIFKSEYRYVSLIPYGDVVTDVTLKGFKYNGERITLRKDESLGISNEIVEGVAKISCRGALYVIESND